MNASDSVPSLQQMKQPGDTTVSLVLDIRQQQRQIESNRRLGHLHPVGLSLAVAYRAAPSA